LEADRDSGDSGVLAVLGAIVCVLEPRLEMNRRWDRRVAAATRRERNSGASEEGVRIKDELDLEHPNRLRCRSSACRGDGVWPDSPLGQRYDGPWGGYDHAHAVALNVQGNVYVTGRAARWWRVVQCRNLDGTMTNFDWILPSRDAYDDNLVGLEDLSLTLLNFTRTGHTHPAAWTATPRWTFGISA